MRNEYFKNFKQAVIDAPIDTTSPINGGYVWCAGYAWIDLTERQHKIMYNICVAKGLKTGTVETINGTKECVFLPNGIALHKPETEKNEY